MHVTRLAGYRRHTPCNTCVVAIDHDCHSCFTHACSGFPPPPRSERLPVCDCDCDRLHAGALCTQCAFCCAADVPLVHFFTFDVPPCGTAPVMHACNATNTLASLSMRHVVQSNCAAQLSRWLTFKALLCAACCPAVCLAGFGKATVASTTCTPCPYGTFQTGTGTVCEACPSAKFYAPVDGNGITVTSASTTLFDSVVNAEACVPLQSQLSPQAGQSYFSPDNQRCSH